MQRFDVITTPIAGLLILKAKPIGDDRGYFERFFCAEEFKEIGFTEPLCQINHSFNREKGTLRGVHYQKPPFLETKIVRCIRGKVHDVAVDIRRGSPTFLQHFGLELSADEPTYLYIPKGMGHAVQALSDNAEILYLVSTPFHPEADSGLNPLDPALNIKWPLEVTEISPKDRQRPFITPDFTGVEV
ncbi:MAG: dTDP-4-dehydrorhamnose 3,5-epimerase [Candidatus Anaerobiospirillum pullicola]|uniref:dTDP-4-dehydrorhamnose 3,5-epimerase n=1 Tax=Candidatus Anaerobiospirillum pullicola TaxID=2838451 RepID=A0A948TET8_9GAMM|nr:dTDP-4-dehydrorhamnose 3,5-epimerase [Candidatus Anaerobiospirillum pullicola]